LEDLRPIDITSFLGGLVNSTAAVAELARRVKESGGKLLAVAYRGCNLATAAMLLRNSLPPGDSLVAGAN
jgi:uncharacterized membrane protein (DUF4010 family)